MKLFAFFKSCLTSLFSDRQTEREVRVWLNQNGFHGNSAIFHSIELYAIQHPGWRQIYRFAGNVLNSEGRRIPMFGVMCDDERKGKAEIKIFDQQREQIEFLKTAAEGCILRGKTR
jgi:hypothetical protein